VIVMPPDSSTIAQAPDLVGTAGSAASDSVLSPDFITALRRDFRAKPAYTLAQNVVTQMSVDVVSLSRSVVTATDHTFSHVLDDWPCTDQKKTGYCWCFAGLNVLRAGAMKKLNLKDFEFSQSYLLFWDKLERSNYFLEAIIETAHRDVDDRIVAFLLEKPLEDGGQWNMFVALVQKYGLVPKAVMPDSYSSVDTDRMNAVLLYKLREGARTLRELCARGTPLAAVREAKREILAAVHRILSIHVGTPPERFDWQWNDKDRVFHRDGEMTPLEFASRYIGLDLDDYVCLVHDPRGSSPKNHTFTVQYLGNVAGGPPVVYLNVDIALMKEIARRTIVDSGEPVWFGCDVGKMMRRDLGLWDIHLFDHESLYDVTFGLDKGQRLLYRHTRMNHAMVFTGVDVAVDDGGIPRTRRWRVENSWGGEIARRGFYVMNDSWFDEHLFEIVARKRMLPAELLPTLDAEPIVLPAWDPMGALAR
jgi:bleomycin hydrolase